VVVAGTLDAEGWVPWAVDEMDGWLDVDGLLCFCSEWREWNENDGEAPRKSGGAFSLLCRADLIQFAYIVCTSVSGLITVEGSIYQSMDQFVAPMIA
jgi:hypothetical protein